MTDVLEAGSRDATDDEAAVELIRGCCPAYQAGPAHGKVFEQLPLENGLMLNYPTDRWSAYDFPQPYPIPHKGLSAAAMTVCAKRYLGSKGVPTDLVSYGRAMQEHLPAALRRNRMVLTRGMVVRQYRMIPYEMIIRGYVLGSLDTAAKQARDRGERTFTFCGHKLYSAYHHGRRLENPIVTPTTKAKKGHDEPVSYQDVEREYPGITEFSWRVYALLSLRAEQAGRGCLLDMKIEVAMDDEGNFVLCDEISADSCRFCLAEDARDLVRGNPVDFYDKEFARQYLNAALGLKGLDPLNPEHQAIVASAERDPSFVQELQRRQTVACEILTDGMMPDQYVSDVLGL